MAFVDALLEETDHRIVLVDRHDQPGGHWNDAYPFVACTSRRPTTGSARGSSATT
jgi:cation diffusion facilitator CzcD-associated flavoprotein CzcO